MADIINMNEKSQATSNTVHAEKPVPEHQYKDFSGIDTESFVRTTLRDHPKDRAFLLNLEKILTDFVQNDQQIKYQFSPMNSYERMLVHRVAAHFGLNHNVDRSGQFVIVSRTVHSRIPSCSFESMIPSDEATSSAAIPTPPPPPRMEKKYRQPSPVFQTPPTQNYMPIITSTGSPYGPTIAFTPFLVRPSPNGPVQYVYPSASLPYAPIMMHPPQLVHFYPTSLINPHANSSTPSTMKPIDNMTQQMASLNFRSASNYPVNYLGSSLVQSHLTRPSGWRDRNGV